MNDKTKKKFTLLEGGQFLKKHVDGWMNLFTGMGTPKDSLKSTKFVAGNMISESSAEALYTDDGLAGRIVNKPAGDMVREWFKIIGDPEGDINRYLHKNLKAMNKIRQALQWDKIFGGSVIQMGIMDGLKLTDPVDLNKIRSIEFLRVYDRYRTSIHNVNTLQKDDPTLSNFGDPQIMQISPVSSFTSTAPFDIHVDRLLIFTGSQTTARIMNVQQGWGSSVYQSSQQGIRDYSIAHHSATKIIEGFNQIILTMEGLADLISTEDGTEVVKKRLEILDMSRSIMNMVLLDKDEKHEIQSQGAAGISNIILSLINRVSTDTGIPPSILIGQAKSGLNSKATEDQDLYNALIKESQIFDLKPQMEKFVEIVMASKSGPTKGKIIPDWSIEFNPLETPTEKEIAEQRDITADTDLKYLDANVLASEEIRLSRFAGNEYSIETKIDPSLNIEPEEEPQEVDPSKRDPNSNDGHVDLHGHFLTSGFTNKHAHHGFVDFDGNGKLHFNFTEEGELDHEHPIENWVVGEVNGHIHGIVKGI